MKRSREDALMLDMLEAIDTRSDVTQRHLANKLGVALGLANSYLRRCVRKGLVKVQQAPANRYLYYLTPQGFAEKGRLTIEYLSSALDYYHRAQQAMDICFEACVRLERPRILFAGMSELAEIASIRAHSFDVCIVGTLDPGATVTKFLGLPVWRELDAADLHDAVLFTALAHPVALHAALLARLGPDELFVPAILQPALEAGAPAAVGDAAALGAQSAP